MAGNHLGNLHLTALQFLGMDIDIFGSNGKTPLAL
jgi:hypothetical protein